MVSREKKKSPAGGDGASLLRTVSTGAGGLEGPTVRMINAHALRQFRADPADRALVLPHVRGTSVRASLASCEVLHWTETPGPHQPRSAFLRAMGNTCIRNFRPQGGLQWPVDQPVNLWPAR